MLYLPATDGGVKYKYCIYSGGRFVRWECGDKPIERTVDFKKDELGSNNEVMNIVDIFDLPSDESQKILSDALSGGSNPKLTSSPPVALSRKGQQGSQSVKELGIHQLLHSLRSDLTTSTGDRSFKSKQFSEWSKHSREDRSLSPSDGIIVVSYFLPMTLTKTAAGWSAAWDDENILCLSLKARVSWVGSIRYQGSAIPAEEEENVTRALADFNCHPIFINNTMHHQFYDIFCKRNLWLLLHQIADVYGPLNQADIGAKIEQDLWFTNSTINRIFRDKVVEVFHQSDIVWIHGFHLMLLPSFLRRFLQAAKIGYFFHTPFPSSEIWRNITRREDLLRGILSADHIGFHLYEYARHFLTTCHRVLGYGSEMNAAGKLVVNVDGREVAITCIHVGVDLPRVQLVFQQDRFDSEAVSWRQRFPDKVIVAGIDRLERLKGIPLKLRAIEEFMCENPEYFGKIIFTIIGITALERGDDYRQTIHDINVTVKVLNDKYGQRNNPSRAANSDLLVHFEERASMPLAQRLAYFAGSDVLMITATRDGLNRFPMEFTLAKTHAKKLSSNAVGEGLIIMSEFISSSRVMRGALSVNPWRCQEVKQALKDALTMPEQTKNDRFRRNHEFSIRMSTNTWAMEVLHDIKSVERSENNSDNFSVGFGMGFRVVGVKAGFQLVDVAQMSKVYRAAQQRMIVLDWGGTLVTENDKSDKLQAYAVAKGHASRSGPTKALKETLEKLCSDVRNVVFVVSGKELHAVNSFFGDVKGLGLGAEHGFFYKWPRDELADGAGGTAIAESESASRWQTIHALGDQTWKQAAKTVMDIYVQRTHGTYIEMKSNALIWQFRDADPEFGFMQSKELEENLQAVMKAFKVEIIRGGGVADGYIEVRPKGVSKGLFLQHALNTLKSMDREVTFILGIGDDSTDEPMFYEINRYKAAHAETLSAYSVTVGKKPSAAGAYVDDPAAVMDLLGTLTKCSQRDNRFFSSTDLTVNTAPDASPRAAFAGSPVGAGSTFGATPSSPSAVPALSQASRALSTGTFSVAGDDPASRARGAVAAGQPAEGAAAMPRTLSSAHLSMNHFLNSIDDTADDEAGLFF